MVIIVDLDGVICTEERTFERPLAKPKAGAREGIRLLRSQGHVIIIYTARSWAEYRMTIDWLQRNEIEYDSLMMGKPIYDVWLDDRAIRLESWDRLPRQMETLQQKKK
jgi:uncharacterized HAD superfamily protein